MTEREQLEGGTALEAQRAVLGDAVVDTALSALRDRLARLAAPEQHLRSVTVLFTDVLTHVACVEARIEAGDDRNGAPRLLWACHQVLAAAGSPRAHEVLGRAHAVLTERAALLSEADRAGFLGSVPWHRAIVAAWGAP